MTRSNAKKKPVGVLYGFRALMVMLVCNFHIWQQSWMPQGFTLFGSFVSTDYITRSSYLFVDGMILLSGFLLYLPYAWDAKYHKPARAFYRARALRILPCYLLAVCVLLLVAMKDGAYASTGSLLKDLLMHLTFTFNFTAETCLYTPLAPALWTVGVEAQFYLLFPLLVKAIKRKPALTLSVMAAVGIGYRLIVAQCFASAPLLINQLPAFLDVFALGFLGAMGYAYLEKQDFGRRIANQSLCALLFALTALLTLTLLRAQSQASAQGQEALRQSQLLLRLPFAMTVLLAMLSAAFMPKIFQFLLDNRLTRFLAGISYALYICHQTVAARLAKYTFPISLHSDANLQLAFTLLCACLSIILAMLTTFGAEKPIASLADRVSKRFGRYEHEGSKAAKAEPPAG